MKLPFSPRLRASLRLVPAFTVFAATAAFVASTAFSAAPPKKEEAEDPNAPVSYFKKVRPVLQANCQGCHQPAKAKGGYVMTDFAKLLRGGDDAEKEGPAIVPGQPDKSHLVKQITPVNGEAEMPPKKKPLHEMEIALIKRWIAEGANDDTPP